MDCTHSSRSGGNAVGKSETVVTSALLCDITESIADSMLHADTTFRLAVWASPDPVNDVTALGALDSRCSASEPSDLITSSFCSCWLPMNSCCGLLQSATLEPWMRSANRDDLLIFGGRLQPQCQHYMKQSLMSTTVIQNCKKISLAKYPVR